MAKFLDSEPNLSPTLGLASMLPGLTGNFINLMKIPNEETLIFWVPASKHFMFFMF